MRFLLLPLVVLLSAPSLGAAQSKDLKAYFARACAACHGPDGSGRAPSGQRLPGRPLNDARWQSREKDSDLVRNILRGKGSMPGYRGQLTEAEVQQMVAEVVRPLAARKK